MLYVSFLDLAQNTQIKLRHQLKRSAGREKNELKAEITTLTITVHFHSFISTKTDLPRVRMCGISLWNMENIEKGFFFLFFLMFVYLC